MAHRIKGKYISIADDLSDWNIEPELMRWIERIETIYWFDSNSTTHLCEIKPSFELWPIEIRVICKETIPEVTKDKIDSIVMSSADYDPIYRHVSDVERMIRKFRAMRDKLRFKTESGRKNNPYIWQIADFCGITYAKCQNISTRLDLVEYVGSVRESFYCNTPF